MNCSFHKEKIASFPVDLFFFSLLWLLVFIICNVGFLLFVVDLSRSTEVFLTYTPQRKNQLTGKIFLRGICFVFFYLFIYLFFRFFFLIFVLFFLFFFSFSKLDPENVRELRSNSVIFSQFPIKKFEGVKCQTKLCLNQSVVCHCKGYLFSCFCRKQLFIAKAKFNFSSLLSTSTSAY